jgi:YggT family protein
VGILQVFIGVLCLLLWLLVFARVLFSWFDPTSSSPLGRFLVQSTEPLLAPIRRLLPPAGMMDFSGLIVLLVLGFVWQALLR